MSFSVSQIKTHLIGMGHGGTLNKVRNVEALLQRAGSNFLLKCHPIESMRSQALATTVWDDIYNYGLPSDFGSLIDLIPQDNRQMWDKAFRNSSGQFDLEKAIGNRTVSIEGSEGAKIIRINWRTRTGKVLNSLNSYNGNGTWTAVGAATGVATDTIFKVSGGGSVKFNLVSSGDGIQNVAMTPVDLSAESTVADCFVWVYFGTVPTSVGAIWGNDLTTKFWTAVSQTTQADGTAFKVGWNLLRFPWSTASQTGTVTATQIDSFKLTIAATGAINNIRVDNIIFNIGRNFDIKYYSKYLIKNLAGIWITQTTSDDDSVMINEDTLPLYLYECLVEMAQQMEGTDSAFDIGYAEKKLLMLYPAYKGLYPSQVKKVRRQYGSSTPGRGRW